MLKHEAPLLAPPSAILAPAPDRLMGARDMTDGAVPPLGAQAMAIWGVLLDTGCSVWLFLSRISAALSATITTEAPVWPPAHH